MKLWQKESTVISEQVHRFTVGRDREFDLQLAKYDVQGSLAHVAMLASVGLLEKEEFELIEKGLLEIAGEIEAGSFELREDT